MAEVLRASRRRDVGYPTVALATPGATSTMECLWCLAHSRAAGTRHNVGSICLTDLPWESSRYDGNDGKGERMLAGVPDAS